MGPDAAAGGTLRMAWASSPRTLDPALTIQGDEYMITQNVYDNLTRVDEKLQPRPMLATQWSADAQARVWTFTLRQGVKFHHGRELKASDVVVLVRADPRPEDRVAGSDRAGADREGRGGRRLHGPLPDVDALRRPAGEPRASRSVASCPPTALDKIMSEPSGTGPFRVTEFKPGERTRMVKFADYWDKPRPYLDELWQVNMPQPATQVASLSGGDVQMMFEVPGGLHRLAGTGAGACRWSP